MQPTVKLYIILICNLVYHDKWFLIVIQSMLLTYYLINLDVCHSVMAYRMSAVTDAKVLIAII